MKSFLCVFLLAACGDNLEPQRTWGDAESAWSSAWCDLVGRCQPDLYHAHFVDVAACLAFVQNDNCQPKGPTDCSEAYSKPWYLVEECVDDMSVLPCDVSEAPPSCYAAYAP